MDFWNGLGLLLTLVGTGISIHQAYKARTYKEEILADRKKLLLIELMPIAKSARDEAKKITTPVGKPLRGVDPQKVIDSVQNLAERLQEHSHRIQGNFKEKASVEMLQELIRRYKAQNEEANRYHSADLIYDELNKIIESLAVSIDSSV